MKNAKKMSEQMIRKDQHLQLAEKFYNKTSNNGLQHIRFVHKSLPQHNLATIDYSTKIGPFSLKVPFFINGMTGGTAKAQKINEQLAIIAKECQLAMASGSVSLGLKQPETQTSYQIIRKVNPKGIIFANLGAEHSLENAKRAIDLLEADGIQLHINTAQELIMPEGSRQFTTWLDNITQLADQLNIPVIVKEVGFGMDYQTIKLLSQTNVTAIDVGGRGGTNFAQIENFRRTNHEFSYLEDWGQDTAQSLLEAQKVTPFKQSLIASGGIKTALEMTKAFALGANACGVAGELLHALIHQGTDNTISLVEAWKTELKIIMTLLGKQNLNELKQTDLIIYEPLQTWCEARNISWKNFGTRSI